MNLEKIERQLLYLEEKLNHNMVKDRNKLEDKLQKKIKFLKHKKDFFKEDQEKYKKIKHLINRAKNLRHRVILDAYTFSNLTPEDISIEEDIKKVIELKQMIKGPLSDELKKQAIEEQISIVYSKIDMLIEQNRILEIIKKENLEKLKDYKAVHQNEKEIRENVHKIMKLKEIIIRYKGFLLDLKEEKINYQHQKHEKKIIENTNDVYALILLQLMTNTENYYFIKDLLLKNPNFLNAKINGQSIVLEILDRFIMNLKKSLLNQKIEFQNPQFYFSLFKEFLKNSQSLSTSEKEEIQSRLKDVIQYINTKEYADRKAIIEEIEGLFHLPQNNFTEPKKSLDTKNLSLFKADAMRRKGRINLTKEYLEQINATLTYIKQKYFEKYGQEIDLYNLKTISSYSEMDIQNSQFIFNTLYLEGQKYAFSFGYDQEFNRYLRIHVVDTTFIKEDSNLYKEMESLKKDKSLRKLFRFKNNEMTPAFTYQFKLLKNGTVEEFTMFESIVKVDRVVKNKEWLTFKTDSELKNFVSSFTQLTMGYNLEIPFMEQTNIEKAIDAVLNIELSKIVLKKELPILFSIIKTRNEEEIAQEYNKVCYYLSKIPKKEALEFYQLIYKAKVYQFYSTVPMYQQQINLDTSQFIGYLTLSVLKEYTKGISKEQMIRKYEDVLKSLETDMNDSDTYMRYQTKKFLEKKQ